MKVRVLSGSLGVPDSTSAARPYLLTTLNESSRPGAFESSLPHSSIRIRQVPCRLFPYEYAEEKPWSMPGVEKKRINLRGTYEDEHGSSPHLRRQETDL